MSAFASVQPLVLISRFSQKALPLVCSAQCGLPAFFIAGDGCEWLHVAAALCPKHPDDLGL